MRLLQHLDIAATLDTLTSLSLAFLLGGLVGL